MDRKLLLIATMALASGMAGTRTAAQPAAVLPSGVKVVWDLEKAYREKTPTRERVCLNGLWRWQPAEAVPDAVPADRWGYFKVLVCWPRIIDYLQKYSHPLYAYPVWKGENLAGLT